MPKVTHVKSSRKADAKAGIAKGESYYWWAFMVGGRGGPKIKSKTAPRRSQLTQSSFKSTLYDIQDNASGLSPDFDDIESECESITSSLDDLKCEAEGSLENMPEGLKEGDSGQTLQTRIDSLEEAINTLQSVDFSFDEEDKAEDESEGEYKERFASEKWQEVTDALDNIDEG